MSFSGNWFDIIILALLIIYGLSGVANGFTKESFGLFGIVGGVILATKYSTEVGNYFSSHIHPLHSNSTHFFVGFLIVLFGVWFASIIVGAFLSRLISFSGLGLIDRLFGFIFGAIKVFVILSILTTAISQIGVLNNFIKPYVKSSVSYPYLVQTGRWIMNIDLNKVEYKTLVSSRNANAS